MNSEKIFEKVMMKISASNYTEKEKVKKPRMTLLKSVAVFCLVAISITGITKGGEIRTFVEDAFGETTHKEGVSMAINNGYVSILEPDYKKTKDGIQVAINSFLADDFTIYLAFTVIVPDEYIEDDIGLSFEKVTIRDEKGRKIYSTDGDAIRNYLYDDCRISSCRSQSKHIEDNKYIVCMEIGGQFPKSKTLRISVKNVVINNEKVSKGKLKFKLDVPDEMYENRLVEYKVISSSDDTTKVNVALLSNTEFVIQYTTTRKVKGGSEYITTSDELKAGASGGDYGSGIPHDEQITQEPIERTARYALTTFDATDVITYHIPTVDGDEILIELKR